jgi:hypothetical protein
MTTPDPDTPIGYASITQARAAGAAGTDTEIAAALESAMITIDRYCRDHFKPDQLAFTIPLDAWGVGYLPVICFELADPAAGALDYDGRTYTVAGYPPFGGYGADVEVTVAGDYGWRTTPAAVSKAAARLAALYSPAPFEAQADAEGNPIGLPPAPTLQDQSDPGPPAEQVQGDRTTGDTVADAWLEPYKSNRVLI